MKRGRQLKSKLRQYSTTASTNDSTHLEPLATSTVTEKLAKLRIEQSRAEANRQKRHHGSYFEVNLQPSSGTAVDPDAPWMNPWVDLGPTNEPPSSSTPTPRRPTRPAAGPPPPPSWTRMRPSQQQKLSSSNRRSALQQHRSLLLRQQQQMVSSLVTLCCRQLAEYYTTSTWRTCHIKRLPPHIKQQILYEWSFLSVQTNGVASSTMVTDTTMDLFQKTEYEELWLESSHLSLERFIQGFWKVDLVATATTTATMTEEPVDDWEDLLEETTAIQSNGDNDIGMLDTLPTFILHMDQQEEIGKWGHIYQVMKFLRPDIDNTKPNLSTFALSSPFLGRTLVSLNLSFMELRADSPFSWVTFAYLMVSTLPHLMWLYTAGCFDGGDMVQGTRVLSILSHGLRKLKFWDLCYYDWLQLDLLTSVVDWRRDLLELKTLCLSSSGAITPTTPSNHQKAVEISRWFKDNQLSRINIIWIDL